MRITSNRSSLAAFFCLLCSQFLMIAAHSADVIQTDQYLAVGVEAEEFDSKTDRWVVTNATTGTQANDPDGNHSDTASDNVYLEVLPDYRVTHEDAFHPSGSLWDAGQGPILSYTVDFPQAGRFYVHLRAYSTGSEDNGAHVGLNGEWPPQARRVQWCAGKHQWTWSSAQRASGGVGDCGKEKTVYLDIPTAGIHNLQIAAREDGFELDRVVLIKDLSGNTKVCSPNGATQISCTDGAIESPDNVTDLAVSVEADVQESEAGETVQLQVKLENLDSFDPAEDVVVDVELDSGMTFLSAPPACTHSNQVVSCSVASLQPTAPNESELLVIEVMPNITGTLVVSANGFTTSTELDVSNNGGSTSFAVVADVIDVDLTLSAQLSSAEVESGRGTKIIATVTNPAATDAQGVVVTYTLPAGSVLSESHDGCNGSNPVICILGVMAAGSQETLEFGLTATMAGEQLHVVSVGSDNESDPSNNSQVLTLTVTDPNAIGGETTDPDPSETEEELGTGTTPDTGLPDVDADGETESGGIGGEPAPVDSDADEDTTSSGGITGGTAQANSGNGGSGGGSLAALELIGWIIALLLYSLFIGLTHSRQLLRTRSDEMA